MKDLHVERAESLGVSDQLNFDDLFVRDVTKRSIMAQTGHKSLPVSADTSATGASFAGPAPGHWAGSVRRVRKYEFADREGLVAESSLC
jgi:hypothetical protein